MTRTKEPVTRRPMPIYCERSILEFEQIYINGGKRGYILRLRTRT